MPTITYYDLAESSKKTRFIRDDRLHHGEQIYFVQGDHSQNLQVQPPSRLSYNLYNHDSETIREILESIEDVIGTKLPDNFFQGTALYNIDGLIMHMGVPVTFRVLRQQMFLGSKTSPYTRQETESALFHVIGNALWNYFDHRTWRNPSASKMEYCALRGLPESMAALPRRKNTSMDIFPKHQRSLFYIGSEDFRYLFGTPAAGRGQWYLADGPEAIMPPSPDVINFWMRELSQNAEGIFRDTSLVPTG